MKIVLLLLLCLLFVSIFKFPRYRQKLFPKKIHRILGNIGFISLILVSGTLASAQLSPNPGPLQNITSIPALPNPPGDPNPANPPLITQVSVPPPSNLGEFVQDEAALLKLGKSLFWDMQLGSDGVQSCASCHFHAGADNRSKNQVNPALLASLKDKTFQVGGAPNYQLKQEDFPFHKLQDPNDRNSTILSDPNDVVSSQGVFHTILKKTVTGQAEDDVESRPDPDGFIVNGINVRRVEPRNTPTVINAVFNKLQFWDGRAKETFNGVNENGVFDTAQVYKANTPNTLTPVKVALDNSSLASLVTGPPLSPFELSAVGRESQEIGSKFLSRAGKKLNTLRPLGKQIVDSQDSVLGSDSRFPRPGLTMPSYDSLVKKAFKKEWWQSNRIIQIGADGKPTILKQGSGGRALPVEAEPLLKADGSRTILQRGAVGQTLPLPENQFELRQWNFPLFAGLAMQKYMSTLVSDQTPFDKFQAGNANALTDQEKAGLTLFVTTTNGTSTSVGNMGANCNICHVIPEFTRSSVRRTAGVKSTDSGDPLTTNITNGFFPNYGIRPASEDPGAGNFTTSRFKTPGLRNIALTAPYMHNGGMATLEQVVDFYNRARGDAPDGIPGQLLGLDENEKADLVAFLKNGLTDERVLYEKAPFDHPQLFIPNGHPGNQTSVISRNNPNGFPQATDDLVEIPAVGKNGTTTPQRNFLS